MNAPNFLGSNSFKGVSRLNEMPLSKDFDQALKSLSRMTIQQGDKVILMISK